MSSAEGLCRIVPVSFFEAVRDLLSGARRWARQVIGSELLRDRPVVRCVAADRGLTDRMRTHRLGKARLAGTSVNGGGHSGRLGIAGRELIIRMFRVHVPRLGGGSWMRKVASCQFRRVACHRALLRASMVASHRFGGIVDRTGAGRQWKQANRAPGANLDTDTTAFARAVQHGARQHYEQAARQNPRAGHADA